MTLSAEEQALCAAIGAAEGELVEWRQTLVRFGTRPHTSGAEAGEEAPL